MTTYPLATEPTGIDAAGKGALYFVPALADASKPTVNELNEALNLSCVLYKWNPNGSQSTRDSYKYCSTNARRSLGRPQYEPDPLEYDYDPQKVTEATGEYAYVAKLAPGTKGYIVDRRGVKPSEPFAADQVLELILPVELGEQMPVEINAEAEGEKLRYRQTVSVTGEALRRVKIAA